MNTITYRNADSSNFLPQTRTFFLESEKQLVNSISEGYIFLTHNRQLGTGYDNFDRSYERLRAYSPSAYDVH